MHKAIARENAITLVFAVLTTLLPQCPAGATDHLSDSTASSPTGQVTLQFPSTSAGRLFRLAPNETMKTSGRGIDARGTISVPKGAQYRLVMGGVEKTGCLFLDHLPPECIVSIDTRSAISITDDCVKRFHHLAALRAVVLDNTEVSDKALPSLLRCVQIETFSASGTAVTGAGLATICQFPKLHTLSLAYTKLTDDSLVKLPALKSLRDLKLAYTGISSQGVMHLAPLKTLRLLDLSGNLKVDDKIAPVVGKMLHLQRLLLLRTKITRKTIEALKALPELQKLTISEQQEKEIGPAVLKSLLPHCGIEVKGSPIPEEIFAPLK